MRPFKRIWLAPIVIGCLACAHCSDSGGGKEEASPEAGAGAGADAATRDATSGVDAGGATVGSDAARPANDASTPAELDATTTDAAPRDAGRDAVAPANDAQQDATSPTPVHTFVYVGGYSNNDPLRVYEINRSSLALTPVAQDAGIGPQPSYITPSADGRTLYVANEADQGSGITVLSVNPNTGVPTRIDHEDAISSPYVFSGLSPDGKYLLAASYNGGNLGVYPVKPDGSLDPRVDMRSFGGGAQAHSVRVHPSGWVYVPTKGLNSVAQLKLDGAGKLTDNTPKVFPEAAMQSNFSGPRHIAFSRDLKRAFVILELGDALISLAIGDNGALSELDRKPRRPANSAMPSDTGAHVLAHPKANFVYGSNRGTNTLVAFSYDEQGKLTLIGHVDSRGRTPRDFDIDPLGQFLIVANQEGNSGGTLAVFAIEADGKLTPKGDALTGLASPAAVAIVGF